MHVCSWISLAWEVFRRWLTVEREEIAMDLGERLVVLS